jgi:hypothetical protein
MKNGDAALQGMELGWLQFCLEQIQILGRVDTSMI